MESRCRLWLSKKNRFCANVPLKESRFCGNHVSGHEQTRIPCPLDPSHSIPEENLRAHLKKCSYGKHVQALEAQPFYQKGINSGREEADEAGDNNGNISAGGPRSDDSRACAKVKRDVICKMGAEELFQLIEKIKTIHACIASNILDSYLAIEAGGRWLKHQRGRKLPCHKKHTLQQASILANMEAIGILQSPVNLSDLETGNNLSYDDAPSSDRIECPAVVEFGAGRGYLTHMLTDYYGIKQVFLVERRPYKFKADRSLHQEKDITIERLRIDIEDLNLHAVNSLEGLPYLAVGKHLCGPATDLALRCCLYQPRIPNINANCKLKGLALATCCHHLCQWRQYTREPP